MADLSILIAQESARLSESPTLPTRIYFPSGTFAAEVVVTPDAAWENTASAALRKAITEGRKTGSAAASVTVTGTAANPEQMLHAQYITKPLRAQTISGNISGQFRALESGTGANATIQIGIRVVSQDGATVRATLLAVGGTTTTSATPPEFASSLTNRRLLTSGDVTPLPLSSYTCTDGDRLVIEIGHNNKSVSTSQTHQISFGDNTVDLLTNDTTTTAQDPWIEFDSTVTFQDQVEKVRIADSGTTQLMNQGWVKANDRDEIAAAMGLGTALFHQENLKLSESLTVVRDLGAIVADENLKCAELLPPTALLVSGSLDAPVSSENLHVVDTLTPPILNPLEAAPSEIVKLADPTPTILPIWLVTAGPESLRIIDSGFGLTQLIGVLHIQDSVQAAIVSGNDLSVSLNPGETLKLTDIVTAARDLTASGFDDSLKLADTATADEDRWTLVTAESLKLAEPTLLEQFDPELATAFETLKLSESAFGQVLADLVATPASEDPIHVAEGPAIGRLDPIQRLVTTDSLKISDNASGQLTPLQVQATTDSLKISDSASGQLPIQTSVTETLKLADTVTAITDRTASVQEVLKLSESASSLLPNISAVASETLLLSDRVIILAASISENLKLQDTGRGATQLIGVLHIQDTVQAQLGDFLSTAASETIKLSDPLIGAERSPFEATAQEILKLGYTQNTVEYVQDEFIKISDAIFPDLSAVGTLTTSLQETLKLADPASMNRDLERAVTAENLKVADTTFASRTIETTVADDALKIADTVTASRDLTATPTESVRLSEAASGQEDPEEGLTADTAKVVDNIFASLGNPLDLTVGEADDVLHVIEQLSIARDLTVTLVEDVRLAEVFDVGFGTSLLANLSEALTLSDTAITNTDIRIGLEQEDLSISDTVDVALALTVVVADEQLHIRETDLLLGMDLATDTTHPGDPLVEYKVTTIRSVTSQKTVRGSQIRTIRREHTG